MMFKSELQILMFIFKNLQHFIVRSVKLSVANVLERVSRVHNVYIVVSTDRCIQ